MDRVKLLNYFRDEIGFEIILANTYHLYLRPGADIVQEGGGLHGFTQWNKNR
jgi:queuine tRNA-ribosyltransferase